jgi:hypothetical protein
MDRKDGGGTRGETEEGQREGRRRDRGGTGGEQRRNKRRDSGGTERERDGR